MPETPTIDYIINLIHKFPVASLVLGHVGGVAIHYVRTV